MSKLNQYIHILVFFNLICGHRSYAVDSCVAGRVTQVADKIKNLTNEAQRFVKEGPSIALRGLRGMAYERKMAYFISLERFKIFDNSAIDQKIFNLLTSAIDEKIIEIDDAYRTMMELERPSLLLLAKDSDHVLGLRFRKITNAGESLGDLANKLSSRLKLGPRSDLALVEIFENSLLSPNEIKEISKIVTLNRPTHIEELEHFMEYLSTLEKKPRSEAIKAINEIFVDGEVKNTEVKKFYQIENKINRYEGKLMKKTGATSWAEIESTLVADMKGKSKLYRSLSYACKSNVPTKFHAVAGKSFVNVTTGLKLGIRIATYLQNNKDQPWDEKKWRGMGWEVLSSFVLSRVVTKMMTGHESGFNKFFKSYMLYRVAEAVLYRDVVVDGGMYGLIVGGEKVILGDDVLKLLKDPSRKKEIDDLLKFIDENKIAEKMIEKFDKVDWDKVSKGQYPNQGLDRGVEELKKSGVSADEYEAFVEILTYALTEKIHAENKEKSKKVYAFNSVYGIFASVENIFVSALSLQIMCMYQGNSKLKQYGYALGITLLDSAMTNEIYYTYRKNYAGI